MSNKELQMIMSLRDEATVVWNQFTARVDQGVSKMSSHFNTLKNVLATVFASGVFAAFIDAAIGAEQATAKVDAALRAVGETSPNVSKEMEQFANAGQRVTTFSHEEIQAVQALLVSMTGLTGQAVNPLTKAVLDMATGLNINVEMAAKMVARTKEGQDAMKRAGIQIGDVKDEGTRLAQIISEIERRWGGMAEAMGGTNAGKLIQAKNALHDIEEEIGKKFLPVLVAATPVIEVLAQLLLFFFTTFEHLFANIYTYVAQIGAVFEDIGNKIGLWNSNYLKNLAENGKKLSETYGKEAVAAWNGFSTAMSKASTANNQFVATVTPVVAALGKIKGPSKLPFEDWKETLKHLTNYNNDLSIKNMPMIKDFKEVVIELGAIFDAGWEAALQPVDAAAERVANNFYDFFQGNVQGVGGLMKDLTKSILDEFKSMMAELAAKAAIYGILSLITGVPFSGFATRSGGILGLLAGTGGGSDVNLSTRPPEVPAGQSNGTTIIFNNHAPMTTQEAILDTLSSLVRATGQTIDKIAVNNRANVALTGS